jgi:hypothetical protein
MRINYANFDCCQQYYDATKNDVEEFEFQDQYSWFSQAHALVRLAKTAYALEHPLSECYECLRKAVDAYRELFALRGTSFSKVTKYKDGKPLPEETVPSDGYTSVDSFDAGLVCLTIGKVDLARELVELAGHSPEAKLVSPRSEVCTTNQQTLSHALNALLAGDSDLARHETSKLGVRRAPKIETQIGLMISAIATKGDLLTARNELLFYHEKLAKQRDNQNIATYWLSLPALGLSFLSMHLGQYRPADLESDSVYCPTALFAESAAGGERP